MKALQTLDTIAYLAGGQYNTDFVGEAVSEVGIAADFTTTGTAVGVLDDAPATLLGTPTVMQGGRALIRMEGPEWFHLAALLSGGYQKLTAGTAAGTYIEDGLAVRGILRGVETVTNAPVTIAPG